MFLIASFRLDRTDGRERKIFSFLVFRLKRNICIYMYIYIYSHEPPFQDCFLLLKSLSWFWLQRKYREPRSKLFIGCFCWLVTRPLWITRFPFILHQLRDAGGVKSGLLPCPADHILARHSWLWHPDGQETTQGFEVAPIASWVAVSLSTHNFNRYCATLFLSHTTNTREGPVSPKTWWMSRIFSDLPPSVQFC